MTPWITRMAAWSAAGWGVEPLTEALRRGEPLLRPVPYVAAGLRSPFACLLPQRVEAAELLEALVTQVLPPLPSRCGLVVATSSGAISGGFERWHAARVGGAPLSEHAWRQEPGQKLARELGLAPHTTVSVACASGSVAFELARGWLRQGRCDQVVVVGYEVLSLYIHAGFAGLGALAAECSRPFQQRRDGLVLGEGGAAFLLEKPAVARLAGRSPRATLLGCGLSQDGVHLTAPDRTGSGIFLQTAMYMRDVL
ncbi:MAG TPA: beta-ketoacyl synthase N-terminal-like domain-containing protein, partial [Myxococcota bacterium]|nr:beta-ketoacyl synthase N-terminal-like domain-containing protein [Myxococcota bacterium]